MQRRENGGTVGKFRRVGLAHSARCHATGNGLGEPPIDVGRGRPDRTLSPRPSLRGTHGPSHQRVRQSTLKDLRRKIAAMLTAERALRCNPGGGERLHRGGDILPASLAAEHEGRLAWRSLKHEKSVGEYKANKIHKS